MDNAAASPSCPRCGVDCSPRAARCEACGFALIDDATRPRGRVGRGRVGSGLAWGLALGAAVAAMAIVLVILFTGGSSGSPASPARAGQPAVVSAFEAELRLELRFGGRGVAAVSCPYRIERRQLVRCELRDSDGIVRALLVRLTPSGELEAAIPYPATLRR